MNRLPTNSRGPKALPLGLLAVGVFTVLFASSLFVSRVENLGPQEMVSTEAGDIHRHDFVRRLGWPFVSLEHFYANWYVYRPSGVIGATAEQKVLWRQRRIAAIEQDLRRDGFHWPAIAELKAMQSRYRASVEGDFWRVNWTPLAASIAICAGIAILVASVIAVLMNVARLRQLTRGCCSVCGYDLWASKDRCPECGTAIPAAALPRSNG